MEVVAQWAPWVAVIFHSLIALTCGWVLIRWAVAGMLGTLRIAVYGMLLAATVALLQIAGFGLSLAGGTTGEIWPKVLAAIGAGIEFGACLLAKWDANRDENNAKTHGRLPALGVLRGSVGTAVLIFVVSIFFVLTFVIYGWDTEPQIVSGTGAYMERTCNSASGYYCPDIDRIIWTPTAEEPEVDAIIDRGRPGGFTEHDGYVIVEVYSNLCRDDSKIRWQITQDEKPLGEGTFGMDEIARLKAGAPNSQNLHLVATMLSDGGTCKPMLELKP